MPRQGDETADLEALLESLGGEVVELVTAPRGLGVAVGEPVIYDEDEQSALAPGVVVLAVTVRPGTPQASKLLLDAERAGASAVVFKRGTDHSGLSRAEASAGVAVLSVPEEMTWTQLHGFLLNARRFSAQIDGGGGIAGVPIGDLFALANAIAGMVGGAVTIEDPARRVLAFSTLGDQPIDAARRRSILGRQVPDSPGMRKLYRRVLETDGVMSADRDTLVELLEGGLEEVEELDPRSAVAIRAGGRMIGSIWIDHPVAPLGKEALHALTEAARIAAPHVIQARAARDVERRIRGEMLLAVLEGRASAEENAMRLGFAANARFTVIAFSAGAVAEEIDQFERERLVDLVGVYCEALHGQCAAIAIGENVYALLQVDDGPERERVVRVARETQGPAGARVGGGVFTAVSSTVDSLREVAAARREAERVLEVLRSGRVPQTLATIEDVRSQVVLLELKELALQHPSLMRGKLTRVIEHDAQHGTQYALTLRAYLDAMGDVVGAAAGISVHPNTFRYRLRRVSELFDIDLRNAEERLVLELQLRLLGDDAL